MLTYHFIIVDDETMIQTSLHQFFNWNDLSFEWIRNFADDPDLSFILTHTSILLKE